MTIGSLPPDRPPDDAGQGRRLSQRNQRPDETGRSANPAGDTPPKSEKSTIDRLELTQNQQGTTDKHIRVIYGLEDFKRPSGIARLQAGDKNSAVSKVPADSSDRLETVRERIETGFYDRPDVVKETAAKLAEELIRDKKNTTDV